VTRRTTAADVVVDGLRRAGTPRVIGVARERADLPILDAARAAGLPVVLAAGETGACAIAAVTGDLVDAPGAVVIGEKATVSAATLGMLGGAPVILITSSHPSAMPGCKETLRMESESAAHRIAHAARLAMAEPRGPVHLDIPFDVARRAAVPLATSCRPDPLPYPAGEALDRAARALSDASRPLLLAGAHCRSSDAAPWLRAFVEALPAPLVTTARAKGALPDPHPLMLGVLGITGVEERLLGRADLVVAIGLDALEPVQPCWSAAPVIVFGPAAASDGRGPAVQVLGEVGAIVEELAIRLRDKPRADWDVAELDRLRREGAIRSAGDASDARLVRLAREATPAGTIAAVDAGALYACVATSWHATAPREFLAPSDLATPGFALPAAIAAHLVHPDRRVVCFTGTGEPAAASELETAVRIGARVVIVAFALGGPDASPLMRLAQSLALPASAVDSEARFVQALGRALAAEGPSLIVVRSAGVAPT